jgi:hypothetical protein
MAIAQAQAAREALTAHTETQAHWLELIMAIFALPVSRPGGSRGLRLVFIRAREGERRRSLGPPGGREGRDLQGMEGDRPKRPVERRRTQRLEELPEPVILERGARQARLAEG